MYLERLGRKACAADCLERALSASRGAEEQDRLLRHLGHLYKRACEWEKSIDIWRRLMERPLETAFPRRSSGQYFEHQARDAEAARDVVPRQSPHRTRRRGAPSHRTRSAGFAKIAIAVDRGIRAPSAAFEPQEPPVIPRAAKRGIRPKARRPKTNCFPISGRA
jgi:tetratricopeptide (TPR) repeat protein